MRTGLTASAIGTFLVGCLFLAAGNNTQAQDQDGAGLQTCVEDGQQNCIPPQRGNGHGQGMQKGQGHGQGMKHGQGAQRGHGQGMKHGQGRGDEQVGGSPQGEPVDAALMATGQAAFDRFCVACHSVEGQGGIAPPLFGMRNHVLGAHQDAESFIDYIVNWVPAPNADTALMPGAVQRFGLMPALAVPEDTLRAIATFIYYGNAELPGWYVEHYKAEHGTEPPQH